MRTHAAPVKGKCARGMELSWRSVHRLAIEFGAYAFTIASGSAGAEGGQ